MNSKPKPIDVEFLDKNGHISPEDAYAFHAMLMRKQGHTDPDEIVADWNRRDPEAPWLSNKVGRYIHQLSKIVLLYIQSKVEEAEKNDDQ